jgi:tyrosyl-tRNA synthetase
MLMLKSTLRFLPLDKETIDNLIEEHKVAPHLRVLQRKLAEVNDFVHSKEGLEKRLKLLTFFGNATADDLKELDEATFLEVLTVYLREISRSEVEGVDIIFF